MMSLYQKRKGLQGSVFSVSTIQYGTYSVSTTSPNENFQDSPDYYIFEYYIKISFPIYFNQQLSELQNQKIVERKQYDNGLISSEFKIIIMSKSQQKTISTFQQSQPQPEQEGKRAFFICITIEIVYSILRLAFVIVLFTMGNSINLNNLQSSNSYERIKQNLAQWQKQIITDFFVSNTLNCPEGYEEYTSSSWSGNIEGCSCSIKIDLWSYEAVLQGKCSQSELSLGCFSVPSHQSILYSFWYPQQHLCIKRLKNYNFYSSYENIINPNGYSPKSCAPGTDYQIDLISIIQCPITNIVNDSSLSQTLQGFNFSYQRQTDYPIVQFKISQNNFCQNWSQNDISPGREFNYILEKKVKQECNSSDKRTKLLSIQYQIDFLKSNPSIYNWIQKLPDYPPLQANNVYKLGFVRYAPWSYSCRYSNEFNLLKTTGYLNLNEVSPFLKATLLSVNVILSLQLLYLFYLWISQYLYYKTKYNLGYLYLKDYQIKKIYRGSNIGKDKTNQLLKLVFVQLIGAVMLIIFVTIYLSASNTQTWFKQSKKCTDNITINYIESYIQFFGQALLFAMVSIFFCFGVLLLDFVYFIWRKWKGDLQQQQENETIPDVKEEISDTVNQQKKSNEKSRIMQVTQQCLIANAYAVNKDSFEIQNSIFFQLQNKGNKQSSPENNSQSFYSDEESSKSD